MRGFSRPQHALKEETGDLFVYGCRYDERRQELAKLPLSKPELWVKEKPDYQPGRRVAVSACLGMSVKSTCLPKVDPADARTLHAGVLKRMGAETPKIDPCLLYEFRRFVKDWLRENLTPLTPESDVSVEAWLETTLYPAHRKAELLEKWKAVDDIFSDPEKFFTCKSFVKDEFYTEYKHARAINSRSDEFKCAVGPIFRLIEKAVFDHPAFIKKIPVADRPQYIKDMLETTGAQYFATDYTSFEGLFVTELMSACEVELYTYMTSKLPSSRWFLRLVNEVLLGENLCKFKTLLVKILATRMSGEMCTSLGNGFSNLMFMLFTCKRKGCKQVRGVVEGDDGLFTVLGTPPTIDDFAALGLTIKLDIHKSLSTASFCGIVFDEDDRVNLTDPRKVLATFGWSSKQYVHAKPSVKLALLRSKAMSLVYQYPGCPIVMELGLAGLRVTESYSKTNSYRRAAGAIWKQTTSSYEREWAVKLAQDCAQGFKVTEVGNNSRHLVEDLYGIPYDHQIRIEQYLRSLQEVQQLDCAYIDMHMSPVWKHFYEEYAFRAPRLDPDLEKPTRSWAHPPAVPEWCQEHASCGGVACINN